MILIIIIIILLVTLASNIPCTYVLRLNIDLGFHCSVITKQINLNRYAIPNSCNTYSYLSISQLTDGPKMDVIFYF